MSAARLLAASFALSLGVAAIATIGWNLLTAASPVAAIVVLAVAGVASLLAIAFEGDRTVVTEVPAPSDDPFAPGTHYATPASADIARYPFPRP
jgi:multisubunit Na+/H+ antiporter MnhC subunit